MKLPWQKDSDSSVESSETQKTSTPGTSQEETNLPKGYTPKKGRPTPSRKEAAQHNGPHSFESQFAPASTVSENRKQRKELKASMTSEQWKAHKAKEREEKARRTKQAQAAMDRGEERYLLERDKGDDRRYIRNYVDSHRYINNFVMPVAIVLLVFLLIGNSRPDFGMYVSIVAMIFMLVFLIEGVFIGRKASRAAKTKYPNAAHNGFSNGFYAYGRATQPRRWRTPKPAVALGDNID